MAFTQRAGRRIVRRLVTDRQNQAVAKRYSNQLDGDVYPQGAPIPIPGQAARFLGVGRLTGDLADGASATIEMLEGDFTYGGSSTMDDVYNRTLITLNAQSIVAVYRWKGSKFMYPIQLKSCPAPTNNNPPGP